MIDKCHMFHFIVNIGVKFSDMYFYIWNTHRYQERGHGRIPIKERENAMILKGTKGEE